MREDRAKHEAAVAKGRAEAEIELDKGVASIWTLGFSLEDVLRGIDRRTGLYFSSVDA